MASSRTRGAVGQNPLTYRLAREYLAEASKPHMVLDYGAGKDAIHAQSMVQVTAGWPNTVNTFDLHDGCALRDKFPNRRWDLVVASNVLNVIGDRDALENTLSEWVECLTPWGLLLANYPAAPRYLGLPKTKMIELLRDRFFVVDSAHPSVFRCAIPHPNPRKRRAA